MILFIEDDLMLVAEVSDFLREHGFSVDVAESGAEALRRIDEASYELCLLDIGLPDCSGFTLCRELRKNIAIQSSFSPPVTTKMILFRGWTVEPMTISPNLALCGFCCLVSLHSFGERMVRG